MKMKKRLLSSLLSIFMVLGLMTGISLTTYADGQKAYAAYDVTTDANKTKSDEDLTTLQVKFNGVSWYIIEDNSTSVNAGTVTLLAADTSFGTSVFYPYSSEISNLSNSYNSSTVKGYLDSIVAGTAGDGKPNFAGVADAIQPVTLTTYKYQSTTEVAETTENAKLYLLSTEEAESLPTDVRQFSFGDQSYWWLRSPSSLNYTAVDVWNQNGDINYPGYAVRYANDVRPALKLNLSSVIFSSQSNTFSLKHTHSFTYAADGATITAACTADGCTLPPSTDGGSDHVATLTISANGGTYDGTTAYGATITDTYGIKGDAKVKYQKKNGESTYDAATDAAPTEAGDYKASITLGEGNDAATASVTYSIIKQYYVWVGGVQVTSANMNNVLGDGKVRYTPATTGEKPTPATLTLNGANITNGSYNNAAIYASEDLTINVTEDSTVTGPSAGVFAYNSVTVNGTLNATGGEANDNSYGVVALLGNVTVNEGGNLIATGNTRAISGTVKNAITGIGWTNTAGTEGKADIAINNDGQTLSYKKVQFPKHAHSFTYTASGATITATCTTDGCDLPPSTEGGSDHVATLTIGAPALTTYGGTGSAEATITDDNGIQGDAKINYQEKTGESTYDTATETAWRGCE